MRVAYIYFMSGDERIAAVVPEHVVYWRGLALPGYAGGPFSDRSGGLIVFEAGSLDEAERLVVNDPFMRAGLLSSHWTKEWAVE